MCPLLTAGLVKANPMVDGVEEVAPQDAMICQGDVCAFWMPISDATGRPTKAGNCAIPLAVVALSQMNVREAEKSHAPKIVKG